MDLDENIKDTQTNTTSGYGYQPIGAESWPGRNVSLSNGNMTDYTPFSADNFLGTQCWSSCGDGSQLALSTYAEPLSDDEVLGSPTWAVAPGYTWVAGTSPSPESHSSGPMACRPTDAVSKVPAVNDHTSSGSSTRGKPTSRGATRSRPAPKLRTAPRKSRRHSVQSTDGAAATPSSLSDEGQPAVSSSLTTEEQRARRNHNLVEKHYRNRLNAQFERLISVLPAGEKHPLREPGGGQFKRRKSSHSDSDACETEDKRLSKAEVLEVATRRIQQLESERLKLLRERQELVQSMGVLNGAVEEQFGVKGIRRAQA